VKGDFMEEMDKNNNDGSNSLMCRLFYFGGKISAKVSGMKDDIRLLKASNNIKSALDSVKNHSKVAVVEFNETAVRMRKSFLTGYKSTVKISDDVGDEFYKFERKKSISVSEQEIDEIESEVEMPIAREAVVVSAETSKKKKTTSKRILNEDFEKEIEVLQNKIKEVHER
jgi:hypothetical protein